MSSVISPAPVPRAVTAIDCAALLALACLLRLLWLDRAALWQDELFSVYWSQLGPHFLLGPGARIETNPPAYFLLLGAWIKAAGTSAFAVRLPSALCSAATPLVVYALGRTLFDRPVACLAALFAALNPAVLPYAQEARGYALLALCNGLAMLALARYARAGAARWLALFAAACVAAFLLHYTAVLFIAACFGAIGLHLLATRPFPRREALAWTGVGLAIALAIALPLAGMTGLVASPNIAWIEKLSPWSVQRFLVELIFGPAVDLTRAARGGAIGVLLVLAALLARRRLDRVQAGILVLIPVLFCLLLIGISLWRPLLLSRVGVWLTIPLSLLLARVASAPRRAWQRAVAAGVVAGVLLCCLGTYFAADRSEDWPGVARLIAAEPRCDGPILFEGGSSLALLYYGPLPPGRPHYAFAIEDTLRATAPFSLAAQMTKPQVLPAGAVAAALRLSPHAVVVIRGIDLSRAPAAFRDLMAGAAFQVALRGDVHAYCF